MENSWQLAVSSWQEDEATSWQAVATWELGGSRQRAVGRGLNATSWQVTTDSWQ